MPCTRIKVNDLMGVATLDSLFALFSKGNNFINLVALPVHKPFSEQGSALNRKRKKMLFLRSRFFALGVDPL